MKINDMTKYPLNNSIKNKWKSHYNYNFVATTKQQTNLTITTTSCSSMKFFSECSLKKVNTD